MKWTDAQQQAIDLGGRDLLVSAAAGSGKTAVLSERVAERVKAGAEVTSFLIITFTKAAAAQMRDKIGRKIAAALAQDPNNAHLRRQTALIGKASICTIDSFCITLVQNYFHLLDLDPDLKPGGNAELDLLALQVMEEVTEQQYAAHGAEFSHLCSWLGGGKEERLAEKLLNFYQTIQSFAHPTDWVHEAVEMYADVTDIDALAWVRELKEQYRARLHGMMERLRSLAEEAEREGILPYRDACLHDVQAMEPLQAALAGKWEEAVRAAQIAKLPRFATKPKEADADICAAIKQERDAVKKQFDDKKKGLCGMIADATPERIRTGCERIYPQLRCLEETICLFDTAFLAAKKEQGILSFSDFEHLALELVSREDLPVAARLREKYTEIFIDEYQDCNGVQEELFSKIARRDGDTTCNLFMVGDIKQSIYKFRQADPEIFITKDNGFSAPQETARGGAKVVLNQNFRSRQEILDYTNAVFEKLMSERLGDICYDASHRLCPGADYPPCETGHAGGMPELLIAQTEKEMFSAAEEDLPESAQELEIRMAVNRLMQLMREDYQVFDTERNVYRKLQWQDVAVLLRSPSASVYLWEKEFRRREIPFYSDTGGGYFDTREVRLLMSLLKTVDNPLQDIPLLAVLRSGLFGFDENELLKIRGAAKGYFYRAMEQVTESPLKEKCMAVREKLTRWRAMAAALPTDAFLRRLLEETDFYAHMLALPGGEARRGNIRLIFEYAKQFESTKFRGLFHFTRFMERVKQKSDFGASKTLSENCNVVRVMSIHKSKGLEFPVVIVGQLGKRFNLRSAQEKFLMHKSLGLGCEYLDEERKIRYDLVSRTAIAERVVQESLSEELRVLYVAFTRAREKLILTAADAKAAEKLEAWQAGKRDIVPSAAVRDASSFLDWVGLSLNHCIRAEVLSAAQIQADFRAVDAPVQSETFLTETNEERYREIERRLSFCYREEAGGALPTKFSVTEVKNAYRRETDGVPLVAEELRLPDFLRDSTGQDAPQMGSLVHLVLQHTNFALPPNEAAEEAVQRLLQGEFISEAQAKTVPREKITRFLLSPLGERLRRAETVRREVPFNIEAEAAKLLNKPEYGTRTVLLQGVIDCMFEEDGEIVLVDYKTDSVKKSVEELTEQYRKQLECYTVAAERMTGKKVRERYLAFLRHEKAVRV